MSNLSLKEKTLLSLFTFFILVIGLFSIFNLKYVQALGNKEKIINNNRTGVVLLDRDGQPFFSFDKGRTTTITKLSEVPVHTQNAFIASEDKEFYSHLGFSPIAILRAIYLNATNGEIVSGASTITQQLARNALLNSQERTITRKAEEVILAVLIERRYEKDEILEMYLNSIYFGEGAYGIKEASRAYFNKEPKDLTLSESAFLAGILSAPSKYSPFNGGLEEANQRRSYVLSEMEAKGYIAPSEKESALLENLIFRKNEKELGQRAPHFALMIRDALYDKYGEEQVSRSGFSVKTTLDLDWQEIAEESVQRNIARLGDPEINGAAVAIDPKTGEIRAMVGSRNWTNERYGKLNMALAPRSPGSTFKPVIYSKAFEEGTITPATILRDSPRTFATNYKPQNYDKKFRGRVPARRALANSLNVPSVEVMEKVGVEDGLSHAKELGIESLSDPSSYGLSLVLGSGEVSLLEMTQAYSVFANEGELSYAHAILNIKDKYGETIYKHRDERKKVLSPQSAFLISSIISDKRARQEVFGNALDTPFTAAVKTGTSEFYKDAWTIGYLPNLTVGVWVGKNDAKSMNSIAGSLGAAPIWRDLMIQFSSSIGIERFEAPSGVVRMASCGITASSSAYMEYFISGTEPEKCVRIPPNIAIAPSVTPTPTPSEETKLPEDEEKKERDKFKPQGIGGGPPIEPGDD